ncbi:unnamed protein product [Rotaria sp. Silwood1]|nr:unnamed protein product [Rotaria sp. Silwood1]CAF1003653.1 unnamed protein product [Rotaria sp. Silwood1]CAF1012500.1 unnamed protein product [Rotaria sp. Silwood1]CAF3421222.1 unnamed protein product [Rotaria sp. Silwood1]CAF3423221.1 unnamed protein product [Rotaria sp. Silwood1]
MLKFALIILLLFIPIIVESKGAWSYENLKQWVRGNRYCAGNLQSPINLQFDISHYDRRLKQMYLEERYPREPAELINNGHTAQLNMKNHFVLKNVAPESEDYKVEQIHFHWGHSHDNNNGSEHLHEGKSYPLEMHMVTYSSLYSNIRDAMPNTRSLAVVGVFFELSDEPNPLLEPLVDALQHVRGQHQKTIVSDAFSVKALIGEERMSRYYRYDGSLTTPPCYESVIWSVLVDPLKLSFQQLHAFRYLHDDNAQVMKNVYRPIQTLGTRKLFRSFLSKDIEDDSKQRQLIAKNHGQYLKNDMKLIVILTSLLMIVL